MIITKVWGGGNSYTEDILKEERIRKILQRYKIIIPFISVKESGNSRLYRNIPINKQDKHWIIIYDIIKEFFPEEKESFETVIYGDYMVYGNMFISSRKIFNDYSKWLFSVLKKYDEVIASKGEDRIPRVDGFLSELLLLVWVKSHISENDIYYMEVRNVETDKFLDYKKGDIRYIIRFIRMHRRILIAYKNLKNKVKLIKIRH